MRKNIKKGLYYYVEMVSGKQPCLAKCCWIGGSSANGNFWVIFHDLKSRGLSRYIYGHTDLRRKITPISKALDKYLGLFI